MQAPSTTTDTLTHTDALLSLAVLGARADPEGREAEQAELEALASELAAELPAGADPQRLAQYAEALSTPDIRRQAYATALSICRASGKLSKKERAFLRELGDALHVPKDERRALRADADALIGTSTKGQRAFPEGEVEERVADMIRNAALLAGALELLPQTLGAVGIVGMQVRLVKRIATQYGQDPSTAKAREFLVTAGVGLAGQALEIYVRRAAVHLRKQGFLGNLAGRLAGPGFTFATTYALGQLAQRYYSGDRSQGQDQLRGNFADLFEGAKELAAQSEDAIRHRAAGFGIGDLMGLLRRG